MTLHFARAMREAMKATKASNLAQATRIIQLSLTGHGAGVESSDEVDGLPPSGPRFPKAGASARSRAFVPPPHTQRAARAGSLTALRRRPLLPEIPAPQGAVFEARSFACSSGTRSYKLYIPGSAPQKPRGLIVMLHGCTQNPDDFARGTRMNGLAEQHGLLVAYPAQHRAANASGCWNWFNPGDQRREGGEPAILAGIAQQIAGEFGLGREHTFVSGLSAGGAMAAVLGEAYPDIFSAIGVHSGLACGSAHDMVSAFAAMKGGKVTASRRLRQGSSDVAPKVRTIIFHGEADATVHPVNAQRLAGAAMPEAAGFRSLQLPPRQCNGRMTSVTLLEGGDGTRIAEMWMVEGAGHAWFGGSANGTYTDTGGPDASAEMIRFFLNAEQGG